MSTGFSLKDHLVNVESVGHLGQLFEDAGVFKAAPFVADIMPAMPDLELKARMAYIAEVLARHLPGGYSAGCAAILAALPPPLDPTKTDDDFGRFIYAPLGIYVENHGADDVTRSLDMVEELTQRFSMEFSVRPFLNLAPEQAMERMSDWAGHENYHVRRLVSESTRPKLPWAPKIGLAHDAALPLLDRLHGDPTRYVTRSVANHLNDITKIDADLAIGRLKGWGSAKKQTAKELEWMTRHALRGLIKAGNSDALALLGFRNNPQVRLRAFELDKAAVARGAKLGIGAVLEVDRREPLLIDFIVDFVKAKGDIKPKVFKWKTVIAEPGTPVVLKKSHFFKDDATTFKLYPGTHAIRLQVNGKLMGHVPFELT